MVSKKCGTTKSGGGFFSTSKAWASYKVSGVGGRPKPEILTASLELKDGREVQFFGNRENNLLVVDVIDKNGKGGTEIMRRKLKKVM